MQSGFLVKFVDGFSSPPHIHPVTYGGVVISGLVHNDDPKAEELWLPPGSFWMQPAGEVHITAAKESEKVAHQISCGAGAECLIYVRTEGTFDVVPAQATK